MCPQKAGNWRFLNEHSRVGRGIVKEGAGSVGLWGAGLLTVRPAIHRDGRDCLLIGVITGGPVAGLVGIEGGVVSGVINLESPGV
jgi:hypothetical protein